MAVFGNSLHLICLQINTWSLKLFFLLTQIGIGLTLLFYDSRSGVFKWGEEINDNISLNGLLQFQKM